MRTTRFWNNLCNKCPKCHPCLGRPVRRSPSQMTTDMLCLIQLFPHSRLITGIVTHTTGATSEARTTFPTVASEFPSRFLVGVRVAQALDFCLVLCRSWFVSLRNMNRTCLLISVTSCAFKGSIVAEPPPNNTNLHDKSGFLLKTYTFYFQFSRWNPIASFSKF